MNTSFEIKSKNSARRLRTDWILAVVFIAIYLTACKGNASAVSTPPGNDLPPIRLDFDLTQVVLGPKDVSDLFQGATYSINQGIVSAQSQGVIVTYPTQFQPHTTAFEYGFSTRVEIFINVDQAVKSYHTTLTQQSGKTLAMNSLGDESRTFSRPAVTPEGFDLGSTEYAVLFRERNAVAIIILRTDKTISPTQMGRLAQLVIHRLQP